jgi:D-alanyl-D-alanine carboxypeptidase/D-alanyl-D-alanine-endopeptidase (penicillin-binding protein 4)
MQALSGGLDNPHMSRCPWSVPRLSAVLTALWLAGAAVLAQAQAQAQEPAVASPVNPLPAAMQAALQQAGISRDNLSVWVGEVGEARSRNPRLSHRPAAQMNPASVMKLITTYAALELLGPTFVWTTPVYLDGPVKDGTLQGNLIIRGQGDPKLVSERLWLLMRRVQGLGIRHITGDIILDRSAFETVEQDPGLFDGEPLRPYNAAPDALLLNYKALVLTFVPDRANNVAQVQLEPPLAGLQVPAAVPLSGGPCADYRSGLRADFADALQVRFAGSYPASCGERTWPVAYADPKGFAVRAVEGMWRSLGGQLGGSVKEGRLPAHLLATKPAIEFSSPALAETIRDVNKYSNNVMAQQIFLSLSLPSKAAPGGATLAASRELVLRWWRAQWGDTDLPVLDNGSGLSRVERANAQGLARMLQAAYASPVMPELMSSLPILGADGTLRQGRGKARGSAHLKTGSLNNVAAIAGYVLGRSGKRYVLVAIVNQAAAAAARPVLDALVDWTLNDR